MNTAAPKQTLAQPLAHFRAALLARAVPMERTKRWRWINGQSLPTVLLFLVDHIDLVEALLADARAIAAAKANEAANTTTDAETAATAPAS